MAASISLLNETFFSSNNGTNESSTTTETNETCEYFESVNQTICGLWEPDPDTSEHNLFNFALEFNLYYFPWLLSAGIVCNILAVLTLRHPDLKGDSFNYFTALAAAECFALSIALTKALTDGDQRAWCDLQLTNYNHVVLTMYFLTPVGNATTQLGTCLLTLIAVERCAKIAFPFTYGQNNMGRPKLKLAIIMFLNAATSAPLVKWMEYVDIQTLYSDQTFSHISTSGCSRQCWATGERCYKQMPTGLGFTTLGVVYNWATLVLLHFIPIVVLVMADVYLIYMMHRFNTRRTKTVSAYRHSDAAHEVWMQGQRQLTIAIIMTVVPHIVLLLPTTAIHSFNIPGVDSFTTFAIYHFATVCICVNFSKNLSVYIVFNPKFRRAFKKMLKSWGAGLRAALIKPWFTRTEIQPH